MFFHDLRIGTTSWWNRRCQGLGAESIKGSDVGESRSGETRSSLGLGSLRRIPGLFESLRRLGGLFETLCGSGHLTSTSTPKSNVR